MTNELPNHEQAKESTSYEKLELRIKAALEGVEPYVHGWNEGFINTILRRNNPKFRSEYRSQDVSLLGDYEGIKVTETSEYEEGILTSSSIYLAGYYVYDRGSFNIAHAVWETNLDPELINEDDARAILDCMDGVVAVREASEMTLSKFKTDHDL